MTHVSHTKTYLAIFASLILLTGATVLASYYDFGSHSTNIVVGLLIAAGKATLVGLFFMHLKHDAKVDVSIRYFVIFPLVLFLILAFAVMPDIGHRSGDARGVERMENLEKIEATKTSPRH